MAAMLQAGPRIWAKRTIDLTVAATVLTVSAPVLAVASLAVALTLGTPVLFRQKRPGKNGVPFEIIKLRTMVEPPAGEPPRPDAERLTRLGRLLRATSIDEIPQLFNVLRGEMSLVGPRPLLVEYLPLYTPEQARRHDVLPGMTGWAQVNGRNALSHEERFALDVWYVDHWSLALDLEILGLTFLKLFARRGISSQGHATMPKFTGAGRATP
jgi:lipopolysaccharide/colanic/teichoic acid biosynthesis glycosyltransferase